jgi:hypothetical protein
MPIDPPARAARVSSGDDEYEAIVRDLLAAEVVRDVQVLHEAQIGPWRTVVTRSRR